MNYDTEIGKVILHHRIVAKIASGAFASVYKAQHIDINDRIVAIKILHTHRSSQEKERENFLHEAQLLVKLKHRYILPFIDFGTDEGFPYLITEYAPDGSLRDRIEPTTPHVFPLEESLTIISQIGQALQYAHEQKILHRDLKPENILFNTQGEALLADFGIAMMITHASKEKGSLSGTPPYMAPESFKSDYSVQSDLYALGCITYELTTGRRPFTASNIHAWAYKHAAETPTPPSHINPEIPLRLEQAILRAMAKKSTDRYVTIQAYLEALAVAFPQLTISSSAQNRVSQKFIEQLFSDGEEHMQAKRFQEATAIFEQILQLDPKLAEASYRKGEALQQLGEHWKALAAYEHATELDPAFERAYIGKGDLQNLCLGNYQQALEEYKKATSAAPQSILGYTKMGELLGVIQRHSEALDAYESALRYAPDSIDLYYKKLHVLLNLQQYDVALNTYDQIIQISSSPLDVYYKKIDLLKRLGRYDEVLSTYDAILSLAPDPLEMYNKALDLLNELQRYEEAVMICDRIIDLAPDSIDAYSQKIVALVELQRYEEAVTTCDRIIELTPNSIEARIKKLDLLEKLQRSERSIETCDEIIHIDQAYADAYYRKGKALENLEPGKSLNPYRARLTSIPQNYKRALEAYITASELAPDNTLYHESIGNVLRHLGKINQAEREYSKAKNPDNKYPAWIDTFDSTSWLFYILPISMNTMLLWILSIITQPTLWNIPGLLVLAIECIICFVFDTRLRLKDQKYHLYGSSILFIPITAFAIVWVMTGFLIGMTILPTLLIFLLIGFAGNAFLFFTIDIYESKTIILTSQIMVKVSRTLMISLVSMLRAGIIRFQEQRKLEQSRVKVALPQKHNKDTSAMNTSSSTRSRTASNNTPGYDKDGYNKHGYNRDGYDRKGFNSSGRDRNGYDRLGYNRSGRDKNGYDRKGFNSSGRDKNGRKK